MASRPFVQLLEAVHEVDGIERIRFTSPHPIGYKKDLIEAFAYLPKLVRACASAAAKWQRRDPEAHASPLLSGEVRASSLRAFARRGRTSR